MKTTTQDMPFLTHVEILRWHIIRSIAAVFIGAFIAFCAKNFIFHHIILAPTRIDFWTYQMIQKINTYSNLSVGSYDSMPFCLQNRTMAGQLLLHITTSFFIGFIVSFPYVFWEFWRFVKPGLHINHHSISLLTFFVGLLFFFGVLLSYFFLLPITIHFLAHYQLDSSIVNEFDIGSYLSTFTTLILTGGLIFQLPIIIYFLSKYRFISVKMMQQYRKHAIVGSLILGAFLTPPDIISQILVALPLLFLYEISIGMMQYLIHKNEQKKTDNRLGK